MTGRIRGVAYTLLTATHKMVVIGAGRKIDGLPSVV